MTHNTRIRWSLSRHFCRLQVTRVALLLALGAPMTGAPLPPLPVTGLAGATFLTADAASVRRFYGRGDGFAEVPTGPDAIVFAVGERQWIEFRQVPDSGWPRRMLNVTLEAPVLADVERDLRERGVEVVKGEKGQGAMSLRFRDPAGNLFEVAEPRSAAFPRSAAAFSDHLQHVGFAVPRAQAESVRSFYRDTLGLPEVVHIAGPDGKLGLVKFRLPGPGRELIELIFFDPPLNKWAAGAFDHMNFEVGDIDVAYRALRFGGVATEPKHMPRVNGEHIWAVDIIDPELTRMEVQESAPTAVPFGTVSNKEGVERALFDGKTLKGWEGNTANWRVEDGAIVAGALERLQPHNEFLATEEEFGDFDLRLQYKVEGSGGFVNGGVQFCSERVPGSFEVSGYQADLGADTDGNLYDESRRAANLQVAAADVRKAVLRPGEWDDYRIRAQGPHIQIWLNGVKTVDYEEKDASVALHGRFALQIHGYANTKVSYRLLEIDVTPERAK